MTTDPYTQFLGIAHGKEWHNAPIVIAQILTRLGVFGLLFTMIIIGRSVAKDFEVKSITLINGRPIDHNLHTGPGFGFYPLGFFPV